MNLYQTLKRQKDWYDLMYQIGEIPAGSSSIDSAFCMSEKQLEVILGAIPEPFPYDWKWLYRSPFCKRGIDHRKFTKRQKEILPTFFARIGIPITFYEIINAMRKAVAIAQARNLV